MPVVLRSTVTALVVAAEGAGYYGAGGGGGGSGCNYCGQPGGGGGGGSSYIEPSAKRFQTWQGWEKATGNGVVVLSW